MWLCVIANNLFFLSLSLSLLGGIFAMLVLISIIALYCQCKKSFTFSHEKSKKQQTENIEACPIESNHQLLLYNQELKRKALQAECSRRIKDLPNNDEKVQSGLDLSKYLTM